MKAVNKQIKENDTELEKVNQLLGKAHKEADAKARKEQLQQEKEVLLPQLEQAQKRCRKMGQRNQRRSNA